MFRVGVDFFIDIGDWVKGYIDLINVVNPTNAQSGHHPGN